MKLHTLKGLKQARKEAGFTQEQLANRINTNIHSVQNWEQGRTLPEYATLFQLTEILGCNMDYLFGNIECRTHDLQFIHEKTGLSEKAISSLIEWNDTGLPINRINLSRLMEHPRFPEMMEYMTEYAFSRRIEKHALQNKKGEIAKGEITNEQAMFFNILRVFANIVEETIT